MTARMDHLAYMDDWTASATEPATTAAGDLWLDTSSDPHVLKRRNAADDGWVTVGAASGSLPVTVDGGEPQSDATVRYRYGIDASDRVTYTDAGTAETPAALMLDTTLGRLFGREAGL